MGIEQGYLLLPLHIFNTAVTAMGMVGMVMAIVKLQNRESP